MPRQVNKQKAHGAAFRLYQKLRMKRPGQLDFEDVAMFRNVLVKEGRIKGSMARLVRANDEGIIRLSSRIKETGARNFAICHELGHWELHENESQTFFCTAEKLADYHSDPMEAEANIFASELLMPTFLIRPRIEKIDPSLHLLSTISKEFGSSLTATAVRFMHLSRRDCIVAYIRDGKIAWSWKKDGFTRAYLKRGQAIRRGSLAWELENNGATSIEPDSIEPDSWFSHLNYPFHGELQEHTIKMPGYNSLLTLLWIP